MLSSMVYQKGKAAAVSSHLVGKEDNKIDAAKQEVDMLISDFLVDIFLFDSRYCRSPLLEHIADCNKLFISRLRCDSSVCFDEDQARLDMLFMECEHNQYEKMAIHGKSYWIQDLNLNFKTYGNLRVIVSKEGVRYEVSKSFRIGPCCNNLPSILLCALPQIFLSLIQASLPR